MTILYIYILWVAACVDSISEAPHAVSARVGSTAILPCRLRTVFSSSTDVYWYNSNKFVLKRNGYGMIVGSGYEGRVDVSEDELCKGICSLVLKNVRITDGGVYKPSLLVPTPIAHIKAEVLMNRVELSVEVFWNISVQVGSTVVLPCDWRNLPVHTPHVGWSIDSEVVFERTGNESFPGEGYEGRVDVPEDELLKGNCSLVLQNVRVTDAAVYRSSLIVKQTEKPVLVHEVELSVDASQPIEEQQQKTTPLTSDCNGTGVWTGVGVGGAGTIAVIGVIGVIVAVLYRCKRRRNQNRRNPDPPHTSSLHNIRINPANTSQDENPNDQGEHLLLNTSPDDHGSVVLEKGATRYNPVRTDPE